MFPVCAVANLESLFLSFCGSGTTKESHLSKFQNIKYKIFTPYFQDNSKTIAGLRKEAKKHEKSFDKNKRFINKFYGISHRI